jgi:hypothetical protein
MGQLHITGARVCAVNCGRFERIQALDLTRCLAVVIVVARGLAGGAGCAGSGGSIRLLARAVQPGGSFFQSAPRLFSTTDGRVTLSGAIDPRCKPTPWNAHSVKDVGAAGWLPQWGRRSSRGMLTSTVVRVCVHFKCGGVHRNQHKSSPYPPTLQGQRCNSPAIQPLKSPGTRP